MTTFPRRYPPITPHLGVVDATSALRFYVDVLGAVESHRFATADGTVVHAELIFRDGDTESVLTMGEAMPEYGLAAPDPAGPVSVAITLFGPDVDAAFARAVAAGAQVVSEPADQFHGDRTATIRCPFGHRWVLATHLSDVSIEEQQQAFEQMMSGA